MFNITLRKMKYEAGQMDQDEQVRFIADLIRTQKIQEFPINYLLAAREMIMNRQVTPGGLVIP